MARRVRLRFGENEVEVEGDAAFISKQLTDFLSRIGMSTGTRGGAYRSAEPAASEKKKKSPAPAELLREKQPRTGTEKLLVLGKYLEDQGATDFRRQDINKVAGTAKIKDIHPNYFSMAVQQGLLRVAAKGRYGLTLSGEDAVNAMPAAKKG